MSDSNLLKPLVCVEDYEKEAVGRLDPLALSYYRSGADEETTLRNNVNSFKRLRILPRFLRDVSRIDVSLEVFGEMIDCPIGASPTAMHKLAHPDGEIATVSGVASVNSIMTLSTMSTISIEDLASKCPNTIRWFQLYVFKDRQASLSIVRRAEKAGYKALVLTVDAPHLGTRREDVRNSFQIPAGYLANFDHYQAASLQGMDYLLDEALTWKDVKWLAESTSLPVLVKGILTLDDSLLALENGARGIIVSNHGGRQLDGVPSSIEVLPGIVRGLAGRCPVFFDGGIRTGTDVLKALAFGAKMVFVGRPILWGLACEGEDGVKNILTILKNELILAMKLCGCTSLSDIKPEMVVHESIFSQL